MHANRLLLGHDRALIEMATAYWLARRVEGDDHEAAHDMGTGEPLVGQWCDG